MATWGLDTLLEWLFGHAKISVASGASFEMVTLILHHHI